MALARSDATDSRQAAALRINLACCAQCTGPIAVRALEELDRVQLQQLNPLEVALWLNNRVYTLVFLGQPDDAVGHLDDAVELLLGDDGMSRDPLLSACISGTRGIAEAASQKLRGGGSGACVGAAQ